MTSTVTPALGKFHRDVVRVSNINAETNRRAVLPVLQPVFHDVAYQLGFAHNLAELAFFVVAAIASRTTFPLWKDQDDGA
jgi:hypothetical protein